MWEAQSEIKTLYLCCLHPHCWNSTPPNGRLSHCWAGKYIWDLKRKKKDFLPLRSAVIIVPTPVPPAFVRPVRHTEILFQGCRKSWLSSNPCRENYILELWPRNKWESCLLSVRSSLCSADVWFHFHSTLTFPDLSSQMRREELSYYSERSTYIYTVTTRRGFTNTSTLYLIDYSKCCCMTVCL